MAEVKTVEIKVNTKDAVKSVENLAKAANDLKELNRTIDEQRQILIELERELIRVEDQQSKTSKTNLAGQKLLLAESEHLKSSIKDQKISLRELNAEKRTASIVNKQATEDVEALNASNFDQNKIIKLLDTATGGYVTKAKKVYEGTKESVKAFKELIVTGSKYAIVQKTMAVGQAIFNAVLALNPITLIIAGIAALIAAGYLLINYFQSSAKAAKLNEKAALDNEKALKKQTETLKRNNEEAQRKENQELAMAKASGASAEAIRKLELKLIDEKIARERSTKATLLETYEINKNTLAKLRAVDASDEDIKKQVETTAENGKQILKQNDNIKSALGEKKDIQNRHLVEIKTDDVKAKKEESDRQTQADKSSRENAEKKNKELLALEKERIDNIRKLENELLDTIEQVEQENANSKLSARQLEEQNVNDFYYNLITQAEQSGIDTATLEQAKLNKLAQIKKTAEEKAAEEKKVADEKAAVEKEKVDKLRIETLKSSQEQELIALQENYNAKLLLAKGDAELTTALIEESEKKKAEIEKKYSDIRKNQLIQGVQDGLSIIGNLAELFAGKNEKQQKKAFKIQKAANIANALIDTYRATQSTFASTPGGVIIKSLAAGVALTAGLLNVKKITATQFNSTNPDTSQAPTITDNAPTLAQPNAPQFNVVGNTGINQLNNLNQPIQAYVVSGEMTTQQQLDRNKASTISL